MRHYSALVKNFMMGTAAALLLAISARPSGAQIVFDDLDWTTDRGNIVFSPAGNRNALAQRPGLNGVTGNTAMQNFAKLDSKRALRRWVWPTTADLFGDTPNPVPTTTSVSVIVDNPYFDPNPLINRYLNKSDDSIFTDSYQSPDSLSVWTPGNGFTIPPPADRAISFAYNFNFNSRESTGVPTDPPDAAMGDYGYTYAHHNDFIVTRGGTIPSSPATDPELALLPNANPAVYAAVQKVLVDPAQSQPLAQWTLGSVLNQNGILSGVPVPAGTYNISLYSPGGGTIIHHNGGVDIAHPNLQRAFVRVSWGMNTVVNGAINPGTGVAGAGGVNDPTTSRIFLIDLTSPGWLSVGANGSNAIFPYDGNPNDQIVVTEYSVTPDDPNDPAKYGDPISGIPPTAIVTTDACRFIQENVTPPPPPGAPVPPATGLGPLPDPLNSFIGTAGSITSPVVGSNKFAPRGIAGAMQWYVSRQEITNDPTLRTYTDPTNPNSTPIADPTLVASVPVFYCLSNEDQLVDVTNRNSQLAVPSKMRVLWRYVGYPDLGSAITFASPVISNVRGRDGQYHSMVFFSGTTDGDQAGIVGRIYALDAVGNPATTTTIPYWTYPSARPLSQGEVTMGLFPAEYEDPNFNNISNTAGTSTVYPTNSIPYNTPGHWWANDQPLFTGGSGAQEYFDGDIRQDTSNVGHFITRSDTRVTMGGITAAPLVIDDPENPGGPMILVQPSTDGRMYTFDAGGRGDYTQANGSIVPGTTQRIWTWPHLSADAYHHYFTGVSNGNPDNQFQSESSKGSMPYGAAYDPTFPVAAGSVHNPIVITAYDGHVYGIQPFHDTLTGFDSNGLPQWNERRFWVYPHQGTGLNDPSADALLDAGSVATIYKTGATASINFTSAGRVYSLDFPTTYPASGFSTPNLRWVFPHTPNPPNEDPTDPTTFAPQLLSAHGLVVVPASTVPGLPNDMVYALQDNGVVAALNYTGPDANRLYAYGQSLLGSFTDSAPIVAEIAPDPIFYSPARTNPPSLGASIPTIIFGDSNGNIYGFKLVGESNQDSIAPRNILPIIYARGDTTGELNAPPALASSNINAGTTGGYYVVGDTNGQLRAYSFGFGATGDEESVPDTEPTGSGFVAGDVAIDMRVLDAYQKKDFDLMWPDFTKPYGAGKTSARGNGGNPLANYAARIANNLNDSGNTYFALDQGGSLYLVASGVYHAQPVVDSVPNKGVKIATQAPKITVTFTVAQGGRPPLKYYTTANPDIGIRATSDVEPPAAAPWPHRYRWPDDRAITIGEHDALSIYGNDYSDPMKQPDPIANPPSGAVKLTGRTQNVFPWIAKVEIPLQSTSSNGKATFTPNTTGYMVTATADISQPLTTVTKNGNVTRPATDSAFLTMGQRADQGKSNSAYPPDTNNLSNANYQSPQRLLYITNPLALTVRGYNTSGNQITDQTGATSYNIIGWYGAIDNPNFGGASPMKGLELTGNGANVGIGGQGQALGYVKSLFAPFDMTQDNSSTTYQGINNGGQRTPAFYVMDRSAHPRGLPPLQIRARLNPLVWTGTDSSVMNALPFDVLPSDPRAQGLDYPNMDPRNAKIIVNNADILRGMAHLTLPSPDPAHQDDVSYRLPQPTQATMSIQVPKYFPANVNRGRVRANFRGTNIDYGAPFTDQAGYIRGVRQGTGGGVKDETPVVGPLNTVTGQADAVTKGLVGSSPAAGYTGNLRVEVVAPPGGSTGNNTTTIRRTTFNQAAGVDSLRNGDTTGVTYRKLETGLCVAPAFRMKVLETTLDMGNVPHGTGYSDLVPNQFGYPGTTQYRYPFAPTATGPYNQGQNTGLAATAIYSPWDVGDQYSALALATGVPSEGRFFRPFTLVSDSNVNLINLRIAKLLGVPNADNSATPNMGAVINNSSLAQNPLPGIARAARLVSDQVNNLLSPPMIAAPFGMKPNFLGNIGVVSSLDHESYSQSILGENNLYPLANPAVDARVVATAADLYSMYGPALFGPQWTQGKQPRPSLHKPRPNDSSGSIATIPDKPHDFDYQANTVNAPVNNQNYLQQQLALGTFAQPAMGMAVPLGTPVGTYSAPIFPYEDALPIQWQEWLNVSTPNANKPADILGNNDDILNTTRAGAPSEPYANPAPTLKLAVRETRLTEGATNGTMPQIDVRNGQGGYDPIGFNMQPSAIMVPQSVSGSNIFNKIFLYWATNRQFNPAGNNGKYLAGGLPTPFSPYNIAYSSLNTPYALVNNNYRGDADFGIYKNGNALSPDNITMPQWWSVNYQKPGPFALIPGFTAAGDPLDYKTLFPQPATSPYTRQAATVRYTNPATTLATEYNAANGSFGISSEAYLTTQGSLDKVDSSKALDPSKPNIGQVNQRTETRTFVASLANQLGNSEPGAPDYTGSTTDTWLKSFVNDPALPKLSPKPLLVRLRNAPTAGGTQDIKFLYVFWFAGEQGRTSLYYNVNVQNTGLGMGFPDMGFQVLGDQKLSTPGSLTWQSDPYPVFRRAFDPTSNQVVDAVDVMFTGQLKNRQTVEVMMARYRIVEQATTANNNAPALAVGQLVPIPFPTVHSETLTAIPGTNTYAARDAAWYLPNDQQQKDDPNGAAASRFMRIYLQPKAIGTTYPINQQPAHTDNSGNNIAGTPQRGRIDPASGLVYFNAVAVDPFSYQVVLNNGRPVYGGGQIVVDARSGTVSFPNIPPGRKDAVYASYTPYILRVNTSRDELNIERDQSYISGNSPYGNPSLAAYFPARPAVTSAGQNYAPTLIMDRAANFRGTLQSPQVLFGTNGQPAITFNNQGAVTAGVLPPVARMWALYRKTDAAGSIKGSVFMKSLRLMARLPLPVATVATNGTGTSPLAAQRIQSMSVVGIDRGLTRGYEVDWVRGRVYFQEEDEGNLVKINYQFYNPKTGQSNNSGDLYYRVAWSDEISKSGVTNGDETTPEVAMPTSSIVNEGQVAAFKDPFIDKLWVFWSSTRAGTTLPNSNTPIGQTDLYYETLAPQFYSPTSNQY